MSGYPVVLLVLNVIEDIHPTIQCAQIFVVCESSTSESQQAVPYLAARKIDTRSTLQPVYHAAWCDFVQPFEVRSDAVFAVDVSFVQGTIFKYSIMICNTAPG